MKNKKIIISISIIVVILILLIGVSYALFAYEGIGVSKSQLIMGDIYMHYKENNQLMITDDDINNADITKLDLKKVTISGYTKYKVNPVMKEQELNELSRCVALMSLRYILDEGSTPKSFCQGIGTSEGQTFQEIIDTDFSDDDKNDLLERSILIIQGGNYIVNPIMQTQDLHELTACTTLWEQAGLSEVLDEGSTIISFCQGTGTAQGGMTFQDMISALDSSDETVQSDLNIFTSINVLIQDEEGYKVNPVMTTQEIDNQELNACVDNWLGEDFDDQFTTRDFCQGTGTLDRMTFQEVINVIDVLDVEYYITEGIIIEDEVVESQEKSYTNFVLNPNLTEEQLKECKNTFNFMGWGLEGGEDFESFCNGTGTSEGMTFQEYIDDLGDELIDDDLGFFFLPNGIIVPTVHYDVPSFEFTISGKNTYSEKDIYYEILLDHGDPHETRSVRIRDNLLRFSLVRVVDGIETIIFENIAYDDLNDKRIYVETIPKNTLEEINVTYRLYMGLYEKIAVGVTTPSLTADYDFDTWNNEVFASVKVNVKGDFLEKQIEPNHQNCFETILVDNEITITGYNKDCGSNVIIPNQINGYNVAVIKEEAFAEKNLTSLILPDTLKTIEINAFVSNKILSVSIPESVTSINCDSFDNNVKVNKNSSLRCILTLPSIDESCFETELIDNNGTTEVVITGYDEECGINVPIPSTIGSNVVTTIEDSAFYKKNLSIVTLPDTITTIERFAFSGNNITEVDIPDSVTYLDCQAFDISVSIYKKSDLICEYSISVTDSSCFTTELVDNNGTKEITITDYDVNTCGTDVIIPNTIDGYAVTTLGERSFYGKGLTSVVLPNQLRTISDEVFYWNYNNPNNIKVIDIPATVTTIGDGAFYGTELEVVNFAPNSELLTIEGHAFESNYITEINLPNKLTSIGNYAFVYNLLTDIVIPDSVISIGSYAFEENILENVVLGTGIQTLEYGAFSLGVSSSSSDRWNDIKTIVNKTGRSFDWVYVLNEYSLDGNGEFIEGIFKYYSRGEQEILITAE